MSKTVLVTSALPYANGQLHFGHIAGAYLPADCYARFERLQGKDVLYICGSDEYGIAITLSAEMAGKTPKEHVDHFHAVNRDLFAKLHFSFDHFSRTTWPGHIPVVQQFFLDLLRNGYIEEKVTEQLFSPQENRFLADRYVTGICPKCGYEAARGDECQRCGASYEATDLKMPCSKLSGAPLVLKETKHWFLRFDLFKEKLTDWLSQKSWKPNVINFARSYVDDLKPRAITRDGEWGIPIPLPGTEGKVLYVWFDAPIGYISATQEWAQLKGDPEAWKKYWDSETTYVQFVGKDNIPFHAVFFPAMVMGQNTPYHLVDQLPSNEFLNLEGRQFSKSDGWTIDLADFFTQFTADQIRYTLAANAPENQDSEFTWRDFQTRCNSELLGKYGNLANRVLVFLHNQCGGKVPSAAISGSTFLQDIQAKSEEIRHAYSQFHLRKAAALIMEMAQLGNVYFDAQKPWILAKSPGTRPQMEKVLLECLECLKVLALVSSPIIPETAQKLWHLLGFTSILAKEKWDYVIQTPLHDGLTLPKPEVLFKRVEDAQVAEQEEKLKVLRC